MGFVAYEAAPGLDPDLPVTQGREGRTGASRLPLVWFGISDDPPRSDEPVRRAGSYQAAGWCHAWDPLDYKAAFDQVKGAIAAGDTYQCNLTTALTASFVGDAQSFYADLSHAQQGKYSAYIDLGSDVLASASPELFFEWTGETVRTRPMKGTAQRGATAEEDAARLRLLLGSEKERAENIIIVDLLRNDLSRIAVTGTVQVPALLTAESYATVWQLTSDVSAQLIPGAGFVDILRALFPCGSVTGAPKIATMDLIRNVEQRRRGVYCGCIGVLAPHGHPLRAQFNVAIRTAHIDRLVGECEYGVGSGITWGSNCWTEYAELEAKCAILPDHPGYPIPTPDATTDTALDTAAIDLPLEMLH
jgi:para-aminobenzoate synthetase/4-amino-4-deoxychorismate lyase